MAPNEAPEEAPEEAIDRCRRAAHVTFEVVDGTAVLIDGRARRLLRFNRTGTLLWELADGRLDLEAMAATLAAQFPASPEAAKDARNFLGKLLAAGLLETVA